MHLKTANRFLAFFIFLSLAETLFAQPRDPDGRSLRFDHITIEQGLSHLSFSSIVQDQGFLWFDTGAGLNKFDGVYRFTRDRTRLRIYQSDPQHPESVPIDFVQALYEDRQGRLWMGAASGLRRYDRAQDRFVVYHYAAENGTLVEHTDIKTIFENSAGEIWLGSKAYGLCRVERERQIYGHDPATLQELQRAGTADQTRPEVWALTEDRDGDLLIGTL
jgi:ligand-binding sensor domain-containing protein